MAPDIDAVTELLREEKVWDVVKPHMDKFFEEQIIETRPPSPTTSTRRKRSRLETFPYFDECNEEMHESDLAIVNA